MSNVLTTDQYWDCECPANYINPNFKVICGKCGAARDQQPDSRIAEVRKLEEQLKKEKV